jgi:hypothetical protein
MSFLASDHIQTTLGRASPRVAVVAEEVNPFVRKSPAGAGRKPLPVTAASSIDHPGTPGLQISETNSEPNHSGVRGNDKTVMISSGWGTWIRTKIDGVRVRSSTVELSPNGRLRARFRARAWRVNSEAARAAQAFRTNGRAVQCPPAALAAYEGVRQRSAAYTCSTATTPGAALSAPAIAALTE